MHEIENLANSPQDLETLDGIKRLPAMGTLKAKFDPAYLAALESSGMYDVSAAKDPLDHDGNGKRGGSPKGEKSTRTKGARKD